MMVLICRAVGGSKGGECVFPLALRRICEHRDEAPVLARAGGGGWRPTPFPCRGSQPGPVTVTLPDCIVTWSNTSTAQPRPRSGSGFSSGLHWGREVTDIY